MNPRKAGSVRRAAHLFAGGVSHSLNLRKENSLSGADVFPRRAQGSLLRGNIGIIPHGLVNQGVEPRGAEECPPLTRQVPTRLKSLSRAAGNTGRRGFGWQRFAGIGIYPPVVWDL